MTSPFLLARRHALGAALALAFAMDAGALAPATELQACAYDGQPVGLAAAGLRAAGAGGARLVADIMKFTGLPQNFAVLEHPKVPNAAAVITLGPDRLPKRVIAYNPDFIALVERATDGNRWAPVSVMAHEVGHHLSGHTIQPGGSQPPTELEADTFSGFVLYKMGASLSDAQQALQALVPEADGRTHPGRSKRVQAVAQGWRQACLQQGGDCGGEARALAAASSSAAPATPASNAAENPPALASRGAPATTPAPSTTIAPAPSGGVGADRLPRPDADAIPAKFDRFVYDAFGVLDADERARVEREMFQLAQATGVEIVTLLVDSLHGMSAQDYAYAMLRQLRVGKLDVGNGALVVVAPNEQQVAIAMGPGLILENRGMTDVDLGRLRNFLTHGWPWCIKNGNCAGWTQNFFGASEHLAASAKHWEWGIRYQSLDEITQTYQQAVQARRETGARYDPDQDPTWRKIARIDATVASLDPARSHPDAFVNASHQRNVGPAVLLHTGAGAPVMLYVHPQVQALMPAGALREGRRYQFVARESSLANATPQFDLLSYDRVD